MDERVNQTLQRIQTDVLINASTRINHFHFYFIVLTGENVASKTVNIASPHGQHALLFIVLHDSFQSDI